MQGQESMRKTVMVTGATGSTGTATLKHFAECGRRNFNIYVGCYGQITPEHRQNWYQFEKIMQLDANRPESLDFRDVDYLFIIPSSEENRVEQVENYVKAAKQYNIKFILLLSILGSETSTFDNVFTQQFKRMEDIVHDSGIQCCFLRSNMYMENLYLQCQSIAESGTVALPLERGRWAPVSVRDVAKAACAILKSTEHHLNKAYDLTGPQLLSGRDISNCISQIVERDLRFKRCTVQEYAEMLQIEGVQPWLARGMADYFDMLDKQEQFAKIDSNAFFVALTGEQMTNIKDWLRLNELKMNQQIVKIGRQVRAQRDIGRSQLLVREGLKEGMRGQGLEAEEPSLFRLRNLLQELISERSEFTLEERQQIQRNEERLRQLHKMEKYVQQQLQFGTQEGVLGGQGALGTGSFQGYGKPLSQRQWY